MKEDSIPVNLYYRQQGTGFPLVLLHGFPFDGSIWQTVISHIQSDVQFIIPDLRGLGKSPVTGRVSTMEEMATDIHALLDELNIEKIILAGHSMGGYVSMAFARLYPQRLAGLGLICTHAAADTPKVRDGRLKNAEVVEREGPGFLAESMPSKLFFNPEKADEIGSLIRTMNPQGVSAAMRGMAARTDSFSVLYELSAPAAILAGQQDQIVDIRIAEELAGKMKHARLFAVPDSGHMPMLEAPLLTAEALDWLLSRSI